MGVIFSYKPQIKLFDISELNLDRLLNETYSALQVVTEKPNSKENQTVIKFPWHEKFLRIL